MNQIFKVIWNQATMSWVAVSELQKAKGKTKSVSAASKGVLALVAGAGMVLGAGNAFAAISITSSGYATPTVSQYDGIGIGISAVSTGRSTIAIGTDANATHRTNLTDTEGNYVTNAYGVETGGMLVPSIAIGMNAVASSSNAIALGTLTKATGNRATAFGAGAEANGNRSTAIGWRNFANGTRSFAMGSGSTANADFSGAMGDKSVANGTSSLALGASAVTTTDAVSALAIGNNANASNTKAAAIGFNSTASGAQAISFGVESVSSNQSSVAIGESAKASGVNSYALGTRANATALASYAIGENATANNSKAIAIGSASVSSGDKSIAVGDLAKASQEHSFAMGGQANSSARYAIAVGSNANTTGEMAMAVGKSAKAEGARSLALGVDANTSIAATDSLAIGRQANTNAKYANTIGFNSTVSAEYSTAVGINNNLTASAVSTYVFGQAAAPLQGRSNVILGGASAETSDNHAITTENAKTFSYTKVPSATVNGLTYSGFAGSAPDGIVSVGSKGKERQIINVGAGEIKANSTDAINGSQLYMAMNTTGNLANSIKNILGSNAAVTPEGNITFTNIGDTNKNTIHEAIKAAKTEVVAGSNVNVAKTDGANGQAIYTVNAYNTTASSVSPEITVIGKPTGTNTTNYEIGLTQDAITKFTKDTQATVVSNDGTVKVTNTGRNENGTVIYDLSVTPAAQGKQIEYFSVNSTVAENKANDGAKSRNSIAIGPNATATGGEQAATALGTNSNATGNGALSVGVATVSKGIQATAVGHSANATGNGTTAIGRQTEATAGDATAIGSNAKATEEKATALGVAANATATAALAVGTNANALKQSAVAVGTQSNASAQFATALGMGAQATLDNSVALGSESTVKAATPTPQATVGSITYSGFQGVNQNTNYVVSVGSAGKERQIQNVAAGQISATSTDAINGSQLYMAMNATNNLANSTASNFGGGSVVNPDGSVTQPKYNVTNAAGTQYGNTATNVGDAITNLNNYVNQGFHVKDNAGATKGTVTPNEAVQFVNGKGTVSNVTEEAGGVTKVTFDVDTGSITVDNTTGSVTTPADENKVATTKTVADAIKNSGFTATSSKSEGEVSGTSAELVNPGDTVTFDAGKNIKVTQTGGKFSFATKDDVTFSSVTSNTITVPTGTNGNDKPITITKDGIDAAGKPITNVSSNLPVTNSTGDAANTASQAKPANVNNIKNNAATVDDVLNAGWNLQENGGAKDFVKVYDTVNFVDGKGTKANVTMKSDNTIADVTFNVDTTAITVDETTGKVTPPANDDNKIATAKTVADAISKSGFTAKANSDTGELINPGDVVDFKDGDNITITRDGANFTVATKDDVTFNSVTFGDNGPKITNNGGNINVAGNDGTPTKITGVKAGENDTDAVNMSQLKQLAAASKESVVSADKSVTVTPTKRDDGSTEFDVAVNVDNETITKDPTTGAVKANTTALNDTNKDGKVDAPSADDAKKLVNAGDITNAINNSGWKAKSGGNKSEGDEAASELINPGDEVEFNAGTNLKVKRVGTVFTFETAQDVKFNTIQLGDNGPKITNEGNNIKIGDKDGNATKITNVANGTAPTDAVNVSQLEAAKAAATTKVEGTQGVTVTPADNPDGSKTYTVAAKTDGTTVKVDDNGNISAVTSDLTNNNNGTVAAPTAPDALVTAKTVADAINNAGFIAKASASAGEVSGNKDQLIKTGETVTLDAGKNIKITQEDGKFTFATKDDVSFNSVTSNTITVPTDTANPANNPITINKDGINAGNKTISNVAGNLADASVAKEQPAANSPESLTNKKNNAATVGDVLNAGWNLQGNGQAVDTVVHNDTVDFVNGKGTVVTVENKDGKNIIKVDSPLEFVNTDPNDKSTPSNTAKLTGDAPVQLINVASGVRKGDGTAPTGKELADAIKNAEGDTLSNAVNVGDLQAAAKASATEVTASGLATLSTKTGENGQAIYNVDVAKADAPTVTRGNVSVKAGDENKVMTAGDIATAITGSEKTSSVKAGSKAVTVNAAAEDANGNTEYTVDVVTDKTIARDGEGKLTVNVDNTTITTDPNTGEVKANTTTYAPTTDGKVGDAEAPDALVSAKTVADAINASGFTLKTSANGGSKISGSDEMINPGETIDMTAGKNLTVKQEANGKVTYATKDDVTFNTVNSTTVVVGDATDPAKSTTLTSGDKGLDVGGDKITNVANGDISPVSTDVINGSQLNNYTKVNGNNIGTDNGAINIVNGNGTTVTSDKAGEVKVNVNSTDLTVADNGTINVQDPNGTGAHYVNATTVAKAVNSVSWNVGSGEVEGTNGKSTYTANADSKVKAGETMKVRAGRNIEISGKGKEVDIAVSDNPEFTSVKTGDTVMNNNGVTINNGAAGKSVSLTKNGLDNGGNRITNVKAGEADTDAVNVGQLKGTVNHLNNKINRNNREARAGIAGSKCGSCITTGLHSG
ncbi:ESPR-type extended signal peptide-containing protein [Mannheimia granulomatis]|uniref:AT family autotransporter/adhesin n=1 Tax=Mannheimia granulomatis TaxID=85402 RepID=A0A011MFY4_9PAST|nr:ESPR-type extended signal peptide-containing protein [Mannheimia granulomatis]EXI61396.1 AT family autotransporter/adhesin [Mannheimia granulomatis]